MSVSDSPEKKDSVRLALEPETFSPPPEMRNAYLARHQAELDMLLDHAGNGDWKPVMVVANHVRGTGAMYGFPNIGNAAEELVKAMQNADANCLDYMKAYARTVKESYV